MTLSALYEGNTPTDYTAAESWFGKNFDAVTAFTGQANWSDYDGSIGWEKGLWQGTASQVFWSIPLMANGASLHDAGLGAYDSHYLQAAQILATNTAGPIYVRTGWEFNGNWENWSAQSNPADYVKAYQQFVDTFRTVSDRFVFVWTPNLGATNMTDVAAAYPGDKYVDIVGEDFYYNKSYNTGGAQSTWNYFVNEQFGLQWQQDFAAAHHKGTATPEWGVDASDSAVFVKLATDWFASHHEVYQSYWDSNAAFDGKLSNNASMASTGAAFIADVGALMTANTAASAVTAPVAAAAVVAPIVAAAVVVNSAVHPAAAAPVAASADTAAPVLTTAHHVTSDFDGDGKSDVLWRNSNGETGLWESSHGAGVSSYVVLDHVSSDWSIAGVGDFDGDGKADVLWRNANGDVAMWESSKGLDSAHYVAMENVITDYQVAGVGDFDGDGRSDILWTNAKTGDVGLWESSKGLGSAHYQDLGAVTAGWTVQGVGDFDGDGKSDILWRNSATGDTGLWESSKGLGASHFVDLGVVSNDWHIAGVGDFDGDGKTDVLWRNDNGQVALWESSKGLGSAHYVDLGNVDPQWQIIGVGDYDGDGKADVLWRNKTTGDSGLWESSHGLDAAHFIDLGVVITGYSTVPAHNI